MVSRMAEPSEMVTGFVPIPYRRIVVHDNTSVIVLYRTGKDFACRCRPFIDQNDDLGVFESSAAVRYRFAARECLTLGIHDELSFGQEFVDHVDGYIQDAARIASQVDDVFFCIFCFSVGRDCS